MALFKKKDPKQEFVNAAEKALQGLGVPGPAEYDDDVFALRLTAGGMIMLGNLYHKWQSLSKSEAGTYLEAALGGLLAEANQPKSFDEARERLLPAVRDRATIESTRWMAEMDGSAPVLIPNRQLGTSILAAVVLDSPTAMMMLNQSHVNDWGVSFDEVFDAALANLDTATEEAKWGQVEDDTYASLWNDDYDVSRILLPKVIDALDVAGDPVVFVPNRNRLIVTGSDDPAGLAAAMSLTEEELDQPAQVSAIPLVRRDGAWTDLELPTGHPAAPGLDRLRAIDRSLAYGATTPIIQSVLGEEAFVANSILAERDGVITSAATWIDGPCLIPETDRIMFFRNEQENWLVGWDDVGATVGHLMTTTDFYPPRYRIEGFPTPEQLASMPVIAD